MKIWGKGVGLYQDCREMGIMDGSNADQLKKGCREGAQPSIRDPLRTWGCTDEDTRRCSDEGEH